MEKLTQITFFIFALSAISILTSFLIGLICIIWDVEFIINIWDVCLTSICITIFFYILFSIFNE